ncbi:hypothetical protein M758_9G138000 [Ceratodon purpureus]|nr:hypothetical protein M758_9G138000 [Ceratodon purpureus]
MGQDGEKVVLYVYDLTRGVARQLSKTFLGNAIEAVWHTGIGVYGREYFFGAGIHNVRIGGSPFGKPLEVLELGYTQIPKDVFQEFLQGIASRYSMLNYSLLNRNCNNFTNEAAKFLVGSGIPDHILNQADTAFNTVPLGAMMLPMLQQLETTLRFGGDLMAPVRNFASSWPNPSAPAGSTSRFFNMDERSSSPFPAPSPPRGSDQRRGNQEP